MFINCRGYRTTKDVIARPLFIHIPRFHPLPQPSPATINIHHTYSSTVFPILTHTIQSSRNQVPYMSYSKLNLQYVDGIVISELFLLMARSSYIPLLKSTFNVLQLINLAKESNNSTIMSKILLLITFLMVRHCSFIMVQ